MNITPQWLQDAVLTGLQALLALRLKGSPSMDRLPATASVWITAIQSRPIGWNEKQDLWRIQRAFVDLASSTETWPAPKALLDRLQPRESQNKLDYKTSRTMSPATRKLIDGCIRKLKISTMQRSINEGSTDQEEGDNAE